MLKLVTTDDGSHTIHHTLLGENYHSLHGAVQESRHVFIKTGLNTFVKNEQPLNILEIGLGTGLNAFLSFIETIDQDLRIKYTAVEPYPVHEALIKELNYPRVLKAENWSNLFENLHNCSWSLDIKLSEQFNFIKINSPLHKTDLAPVFDLIYFDAFSPEIQPEMWSLDVFQKLHNSLKDGGCLVTYCAKGEVKRTMKAAGFKVESHDGPPGKREIVKAVKNLVPAKKIPVVKGKVLGKKPLKKARQ
jgi:tRNA U34 5-methylaminomethyl-2-thiouridine-forming methyltransferase MnmC